MIRFACPGCEATFSVPGEKAGKIGKCPKCAARFVIPTPELNSQPKYDPTPPPVPTNETEVEIAPCPQCKSRLMVAAIDLGSEVECPFCRVRFLATSVVNRLTDPVRQTRRKFYEPDVDDDLRPRRRISRKTREEAERAATTGVVFGIIALAVWLCPITGFVLGSLAIRFGIQARKLACGELGMGGLVMGSLAIVLSLLNCVRVVLLQWKV